MVKSYLASYLGSFAATVFAEPLGVSVNGLGMSVGSGAGPNTFSGTNTRDKACIRRIQDAVVTLGNLVLEMKGPAPCSHRVGAQEVRNGNQDAEEAKILLNGRVDANPPDEGVRTPSKPWSNRRRIIALVPSSKIKEKYTLE